MMFQLNLTFVPLELVSLADTFLGQGVMMTVLDQGL